MATGRQSRGSCLWRQAYLDALGRHHIKAVSGSRQSWHLAVNFSLSAITSSCRISASLTTWRRSQLVLILAASGQD